MSTATPATADRSAEPRWGMGDAVGGWLIAYTSAIIIGGLVISALGYGDAEQSEIPLSAIALTYPPLWIGFVGVPVFVAATKGRGVIEDFRVRLRAIDVPVATVIGVVAQLLVVPLVSLPIMWLSGTSADDLGKPARELADKADTAGGIILFFVIVGICAPIAEELFFRGLVLRSIEKRFGSTWGLIGSSVVFGATHFQALQFLALTVAGLIFGYLAVRTGRLGPAIIAHMAFNITTVTVLVAT